jgi:hypothetical protein
MKTLLLASLFVLATALACTPKEGATTPETDPAANNATPTDPANNATPTDPAPEADGKGAPDEGEEK